MEVKGQNHRTCLYQVVDNAQIRDDLQSKQGRFGDNGQLGQSLSPKLVLDIL
jgi:hypothetical protein